MLPELIFLLRQAHTVHRSLELFVFYAAFFEETFDFGFGEDNRFRFVLLGFDEIVELFMDLKDCVVGTVITKGFFHQSIEGVTLGSGR